MPAGPALHNLLKWSTKVIKGDQRIQLCWLLQGFWWDDNIIKESNRNCGEKNLIKTETILHKWCTTAIPKVQFWIHFPSSFRKDIRDYARIILWVTMLRFSWQQSKHPAKAHTATESTLFVATGKGKGCLEQDWTCWRSNEWVRCYRGLWQERA